LGLPGLEFPLDLSGGVQRFRHRRGALQSAELRTTLGLIEAWLGREWSGLLGGLSRSPSVWPTAHGVGVGVVGAEGALAFELHWVPEGADARFVVAQARGVVSKGPVLGQILRALETLGRGWLTRQGRLLLVPRTPTLLLTAILPNLGVRVPEVKDLRLGELERRDGELHAALDSTLDEPRFGPELLRELEFSRLSAEADDLLASGKLDLARDRYLGLLERAPRHPELVRQVAEIDRTLGGRAEAALGLLRETLPLAQASGIAAALLGEAGELEEAREVVTQAATEEVFGPLAALLWCALADRETSGLTRGAALDHAVSRAPALARVRWQRFEFRASRGDVEGALADAEHLEALETGPRDRHVVCRRAAEAMARAGFVREAGRGFERALRYLPDDAVATAGLARAFLEAGKRDRAVLLLERALVLCDRDGTSDYDALFELACLLADYLHDYPHAIARIRQVPNTSARGIEARALEATWRVKLGDLVGASLAYARLRDAVELSDRSPAPAPDWLLEAARFERDVRRDVLAAERHLAVALAKQPRSEALADAYREVAALVAEAANQRRSDGDR
jgi:tetratricopeptide (TPR) repeat protein